VSLAAVLHDHHDWRIWFAREGIPAGMKLTELHVSIPSEPGTLSA
jgi:hypothetical protein